MPFKAKSRKMRRRMYGGFYPSVMGSLLKSGPIFLGAAFFQGKRLLNNNASRMKSRRRAYKSRTHKRR